MCKIDYYMTVSTVKCDFIALKDDETSIEKHIVVMKAKCRVICNHIAIRHGISHRMITMSYD